MRRGLWMIFRWPLALALLSLFGLLSALIGDEAYDLLSWLTLGMPLLLVAVVWIRLRRRSAALPVRDGSRLKG